MVPPYRPQPAAAPPGSGRRIALLSFTVVLALLLGVGLAWASTGGRSPAAAGPCVDLMVASATGGLNFHVCGSQGVAWCRDEAARHDDTATRAVAACRRSGLLAASTP